MNERFNYSIEKPKGTYRIITLGDSFTYGLNVNTEDNWTERLENVLNTDLKCKNIDKFEIINLGVEGYDIEYSVERFRLKGKKYNPDLVLWLLGGNDFNRINEFLQPTIVKVVNAYLNKDKTQGPFTNGELTDQLAKIDKEFEDRYSPEFLVRYSKNALFKINNYYGGALIIISFPMNDEYKQIINEFVKKRGNAFYFNSLAFPDEKEKLPDGHPNEKGHLRIAKDIFNYLTKNKIIPCD